MRSSKRCIRISVRVNQNIARALSTELHAITNEAQLDTLGIITATGARVAFFSKTKADSAEISAISATVVNTSAIATNRLGFEDLQDVMLRGSNGFLILRTLSPRFMLFGGTTNIKSFTKAASVLVAHSQKLANILEEVPDEMY